MTRLIAGLGSLLLTLGCASGGAVTPDSVVDELIGTAREVGALPAKHEEGAKRGHRRGDKLMGLIQKAQAGEIEGVTLSGTLEGGGTATLDNVQTPKGTLSGTFSWSGKPAEDATVIAHHTTKHLTFVPATEGGPGGVPELGIAKRYLTEIEGPILPEAFDTVQIDADITVNGTKGDRESFTRTGTTTLVFFNDGATVRTITLIWDAPASLTVDVDGQRQVIDLSQVRAEFARRRGDRAGHRPESVPANPVILPTSA